VLHFLVEECGVDHHPEWATALAAGRETGRRRQLGAAVRDVPEVAARVLSELGWTVEPPEEPTAGAKPASLTTW
jgi:hypothetical protein